jgi:spore coat polysaccharide biosynthesis protein SpsF
MICLIIQARFNSKRLPGKVLKSLNGMPMLWYTIESLKQTKAYDRLLIATSKESSDDPIATFCKDYKVECFRGSLDNVASRFYEIGRFTGCKAMVRICGDSPLIDFRIVERAIKDYVRLQPDLVTNVNPKTFPKGMSVEVIKSETFLNNYPYMSDPSDLEHVTPYFYRNEAKLKILNFTYPVSANHIQLSVDAQSDFDRVENIIKSMKNPHWSYTLNDIIKML